MSAEKLVMVGGNLDDDNAEIFNKIIEYSTPNKTTEPYLGIVTCASGEDAEINS